MQERPHIAKGLASAPSTPRASRRATASWCATACSRATCWAATRRASSASRPPAMPAACTICIVARRGEALDFAAASCARMGTGLFVTELMGQGVNGVTGDYSRGASGFWVEDGAHRLPGARDHDRRQPEAHVPRHRRGRHRRRCAGRDPHRVGADRGNDDRRRVGIAAPPTGLGAFSSTRSRSVSSAQRRRRALELAVSRSTAGTGRLRGAKWPLRWLRATSRISCTPMRPMSRARQQLVVVGDDQQPGRLERARHLRHRDARQAELGREAVDAPAPAAGDVRPADEVHELQRQLLDLTLESRSCCRPSRR